jgi:peptidoglycan/xylan/chitin deacetylase (PgdA/CDA1 family)
MTPSSTESRSTATRSTDVPQSAAHGIMFHHFCDSRHPKGQGAITARQFSDLLHALDVRRFLPAEAWLERSVQGRLKEGDLCITFDDALRCQYDIALPVLEELGLTAFWFVYSSVFEGQQAPLEVFRYFRTVAFKDIEDFYAAFFKALEQSEYAAVVRQRIAGVDFASYSAETLIYTLSDRRFRYVRDEALGPDAYEALMWRMIRESGWETRIPTDMLWMDDACLRSLSDAGHVVGLHSYSHPTALAYLGSDDQKTEYSRNHAHILRVTDRPAVVVSHPCNSYQPETLAILRDLGVKVGFRADMTQQNYSILEQPRMDHALLVRQFGLGG